eukprot:COSAG02_NODE_11711_length_1670_cov_1.063017_3_plen_60_part_00
MEELRPTAVHALSQGTALRAAEWVSHDRHRERLPQLVFDVENDRWKVLALCLQLLTPLL